MRLKPFLTAAVFFAAMIVIAHFFAPPGYDWTQNTISDLGSQGHVYKWIMQSGFIGFGAILTWGAANYFRENRKLYFLFFVAGYGLSVLLTGFFCAAPIHETFAFSIREAALHSLFATFAGISMSVGILWQVLASSNAKDRWMRIAFLFLIAGISGLFGIAENHILELDKGIIQRVLYLVGLAWLIYEERQISFNGALQ